MNIFLDVDGVLLGKKKPASPKVQLAVGAGALIDFCLEHFSCYWLTTHCRGDASQVISYIAGYAPPDLLEKLTEIQPTNFQTLKLEALFGDYLWLDDSPLAYEIMVLKERNQLHRWIEVNTYQRPNDLYRVLKVLMKII